MDCYAHEGRQAVGVCAACGKALCRGCVARESPQLVCAACNGRVIGFEYRSKLAIGGWPLVHVCLGFDAATRRPKIARGVIAVGNVAVGGLAIGGAAFGLFTLAGASFGLLSAIGGFAIGIGLALGGFAVGGVAVGGLAIGWLHAIGGLAIAPSIIDGRHCDEATREFLGRFLGGDRLPPCRR
jgi:hypothetical protein